MAKSIWYLIKFFKEKDHADYFRKGNLYLNRLSYFKKEEESTEDIRSDSNEALSHYWQPEDLIIELNLPGIGKTKLTKSDLAGPVTVGFESFDHLHIFCMYAVHTDGFDVTDEIINYSKEDAEKLKNQLKIDERCFNFGSYAVVVPAVPFIEIVKRSLEVAKQTSRLQLVNYINGTTYHGAIKRETSPFTKLNKFSYQNEYRICINSGTFGDDHLIISIGDIQDISALTRSNQLNDLFKISSIET
jgi:hypothetical protein